MPDEGDEPVSLVTTGSGSRCAREVEKCRLAGRRGLGGSWWVIAVVDGGGLDWGSC